VRVIAYSASAIHTSAFLKYSSTKLQETASCLRIRWYHSNPCKIFVTPTPEISLRALILKVFRWARKCIITAPSHAVCTALIDTVSTKIVLNSPPLRPLGSSFEDIRNFRRKPLVVHHYFWARRAEPQDNNCTRDRSLA